jgi:hypothetical protein
MNRDFGSYDREKAIQRYVSALDNGDLDAVLLVLEEATGDPVLDQMIMEVNQAIEQEEGLTPFAKDANLVQNLVQAHFDHFEISVDEHQISVGDVAARMQADRKVPVSDEAIHKHLLKLTTPLPEILNIQAIRKLASKLQINASERFWRVFRDTAIMLGIGRGQARMAAARKQKQHKSSTKKNQGKSEDK